MWYYMVPQGTMISMHDIILGFYEPTQLELNANICQGCFGTTINLINGDAECGWSTAPGYIRAGYFEEFCTLFGADCPLENTGCETQVNFDWGSGRKNWLEQAWDGAIQCNAVSYATEFFIYDVNDYKRCVCRNFDADNELCMGDPAYPPDDTTTDDTTTDDNTDTTDDTTDTTDSTDTTPSTGTDTGGTTTGDIGLWTGYDWNDGTV
jgi:hypothetical protein